MNHQIKYERPKEDCISNKSTYLNLPTCRTRCVYLSKLRQLQLSYEVLVINWI